MHSCRHFDTWSEQNLGKVSFIDCYVVTTTLILYAFFIRHPLARKPLMRLRAIPEAAEGDKMNAAKTLFPRVNLQVMQFIVVFS